MNGISRLDIKQLRVLSSLLELQNLSQVAKKMGLTQQAISEQLRKLRDLFDDRLFIRQGNNMVATPKAQGLKAPINNILKHPHHYSWDWRLKASAIKQKIYELERTS